VPKAKRAFEASRLTDIPNIGKSIARDLEALGISRPAQLVGVDPYELYARMERESGLRHDPCLCDTFIAAVRFMEGSLARPWWFYTSERKDYFSAGASPTRTLNPHASLKT